VSFHAEARVLSRLRQTLSVLKPFRELSRDVCLLSAFRVRHACPHTSRPSNSRHKQPGPSRILRLSFHADARVLSRFPKALFVPTLLRPVTLYSPCLSLSSCDACPDASRPSTSPHRQPGPSRMQRVSFHAHARVLSRLRQALSVL